MKELDRFKLIDHDIANVAMNTFQRHLWYLSDELILLSLFSNKVPDEQKFEICQELLRQVGDRTINSIQYTQPLDNIQNLRLVDFISPRSWFFIQILDINAIFMEEDPYNWNELQVYQIEQKKVNDLIAVTNDSSERALKLGSQIIDEQRVRTEARLQDYIVNSSVSTR